MSDEPTTAPGNGKQILGPGPGIRNKVTACRQCGKAVRMAELKDGSTGQVNANPLTFITPDGGGVVLFQPHDQSCPNPLAIVLPDGQRKIIT